MTGSNPLATNGFGAHSPGGYGLLSCFLVEAVLSFIFLVVILGSTDGRAPKGFAPIAIGMALTLIHLISIPVTNTSVNPARSLGPAIFSGPELLAQVWLFWVAPILGAAFGGLFYNSVLAEGYEPDIDAVRRFRAAGCAGPRAIAAFGRSYVWQLTFGLSTATHIGADAGGVYFAFCSRFWDDCCCGDRSD